MNRPQSAGKPADRDTGATVFVVDDDDAVRDSLCMLLESVGLRYRSYPSAAEFLLAYKPDHAGCLVLDIRMPGMSGIELQERLNEIGAILPVIFITGHGDVPLAVKAMRAGAVDFLQKPYNEQELLDRIHRALQGDGDRRRELLERDLIVRRHGKLTPREREVFDLIVQGKPNKVVASDLGVSQRTVEIHRSRVMEKMEATSFAHLMNMAMLLQEGS
ncbi:MAG TPA: response regulator [Thermoanaerobaculia bacterium]|nr:response regulator [Thermoanaerobaculia bacterium]